MDSAQFRAYQFEVVGEEMGAHKRLADLLGTSEISIKRFATDGRPIPDYIAQSLRAMALLSRQTLLAKLREMP